MDASTALHFVQHDQGNVMPHAFGHSMHMVMACTLLPRYSEHLFPCHAEHPFPCRSEHPFLVIPSQSEESSACILHCDALRSA